MQLKQFTFYELYWELLKQSGNATAGRLIKNICTLMFTEEPPLSPQSDKESYFWSNMEGLLQKTKETESSGRPMRMPGCMRKFIFTDIHYKALKILNDEDGGKYIKSICGYVFDDVEAEGLPDKVGFCYKLARRKLKSAQRSRTKKKKPYKKNNRLWR